MVVNAEGKGLATTRSGKKRTAREPLLKCRKISDDVKTAGVSYCGISSEETAYGRSASGRRGAGACQRAVSGTWEPETPMPTEKPQVKATTRARVRMGSLRVGLPIVVKKQGNARGAKGQVTRVLTNCGQLETGGAERLGRKVATFTGWHEPCDGR